MKSFSKPCMVTYKNLPADVYQINEEGKIRCNGCIFCVLTFCICVGICRNLRYSGSPVQLGLAWQEVVYITQDPP